MSPPIFFVNHNTEDCRDMVGDLVQSYNAMGCEMYLKVHFVQSDTFHKINSVQ
jgi:hypothetical protein